MDDSSPPVFTPWHSTRALDRTTWCRTVCNGRTALKQPCYKASHPAAAGLWIAPIIMRPEPGRHLAPSPLQRAWFIV